jgi:pheromone shutdown-related protein TraB
MEINNTESKILDSNNVTKLNYNNKEIYLLGTAHISQTSVKEVKDLIDTVLPDSVCIELDKQRYESISNEKKWQNTKVLDIVKSKKAGMFLVNIVLSNYQKKLAEQFNINPGAEMMQGIKLAKDYNANLVLADRNIQTTFSRIWRYSSLWEKAKIITSLLYSIIDSEEISEEELEELKSGDMLSSALSELGNSFKGINKYLLEERNEYLANKIKNAKGETVVAILGAAHVPGVKEEIFKEQNMSELSSLPKKSDIGKIFAWLIPIALLIMIIATLSVNLESGFEQIKTWILWNGTLSAIGTFIAGGHILSVLTAFIAAPISSLSPLLAAGWFAGITETLIRKPKVSDFENLNEDLTSFRKARKNRIMKVLLVVVFANIGSVIGTILGGLNIIDLFIQTFL